MEFSYPLWEQLFDFNLISVLVEENFWFYFFQNSTFLSKNTLTNPYLYIPSLLLESKLVPHIAYISIPLLIIILGFIMRRKILVLFVLCILLIPYVYYLKTLFIILYIICFYYIIKKQSFTLLYFINSLFVFFYLPLSLYILLSFYLVQFLKKDISFIKNKNLYLHVFLSMIFSYILFSIVYSLIYSVDIGLQFIYTYGKKYYLPLGLYLILSFSIYFILDIFLGKDIRVTHKAYSNYLVTFSICTIGFMILYNIQIIKSYFTVERISYPTTSVCKKYHWLIQFDNFADFFFNINTIKSLKLVNLKGIVSHLNNISKYSHLKFLNTTFWIKEQHYINNLLNNFTQTSCLLVFVDNVTVDNNLDHNNEALTRLDVLMKKNKNISIIQFQPTH